MFREGHYLEVIKVAENCAAMIVITVQEKIVEIRDKKVSTNKWLDVGDWAEIYEILQKALLRDRQAAPADRSRARARRKSTKNLEIKYTFEASAARDDKASPLPTIRVEVSPAKRKRRAKSSSEKCEEVQREDSKTREVGKDEKNREERVGMSSESSPTRSQEKKPLISAVAPWAPDVEEYVPGKVSTGGIRIDLSYVPSKKSSLQGTVNAESSNEYIPSLSTATSYGDLLRYVPNSISTANQGTHEVYEPRSTSTVDETFHVYVPSSKNAEGTVEEYEPDFTSASKSMKFDDSYVPSSTGNATRSKRPSKRKSSKHRGEREKKLTKKLSSSLVSDEKRET
ncbi:uncharacterized protein LOC105695227 isoform X2 [Orussus abietinus]|uniref:uncharacterized protein LOC105695227 isoform X2 n=1 Tax=Orussus abietinus TaxID=222816 RepID=UPI0006256CEA|nr:uncharacterized protein LOC105695227 isoform X2 [Orussus abietinus]